MTLTMPLHKYFKIFILSVCLTQAQAQAHVGSFLTSTKGRLLTVVGAIILSESFAPLKPDKKSIRNHVALQTLALAFSDTLVHLLSAHSLGPTIENYKKTLVHGSGTQEATPLAKQVKKRLESYTQIAQELCKKTGVNINSFHVLSADEFNAEAIGSHNNAHITITDAWLTAPYTKDYNDFEGHITAVLAHELGHVSMSHTTKHYAWGLLSTGLSQFVYYKMLCSWSDYYQKIKPYLATKISEIHKKEEREQTEKEYKKWISSPFEAAKADFLLAEFLQEHLFAREIPDKETAKQFEITRKKTIQLKHRAHNMSLLLSLTNALIVVPALSRFFEYQADAYAAQHGYGKDLANSLNTLNMRSMRLTLAQHLKQKPSEVQAHVVMQHFYLQDRQKHHSFLTALIALKSSHPSTAARKTRLNQTDVTTKSVWRDPECWKFW